MRIFFVTAILGANATFAQSFYCGFGGGYGIATGKTNDFDNKKTNYNAAANTYEYIAHPNSLGKGRNESVYIGYMFSNNMALELGGSFMQGISVTVKGEFHDNVSDYHEKRKHVLSANMNRIVPSIKISTGRKQLYPYITAGVIIGVGGKMEDAVTIETWGTGSNNIDMEAKAEYILSVSFCSIMCLT